MQTLLVFTFCVVFVSTTRGEVLEGDSLQIICDDPVRHRKSWLDMDEHSRSLYTEGFQLLRDNGKLDLLSKAHSTDFMATLHRSSLLTYYHTYLIWEIESQIRKLGGKFACFAMPWFEFTQEHNHEEHPFMFNSGLGGNGDPDNNDCVPNDWGLQRYTTPNLCAHDETEPDCCLKRKQREADDIIWGKIPDTTDLFPGITDPGGHEFDEVIRAPHLHLHKFVGGHMSCGHAMDDPIFAISHSFLDLVRVLWMDCHGYDAIDTAKDEIPYALYHPYCADEAENGEEENTEHLMCAKLKPFLGLDDELQWNVLPRVPWTLVGQGETITVRRLFNMQESFNIEFDLKGYYAKYPQLKEMCQNMKKWDGEEAVVEEQIGSQNKTQLDSMTAYLLVFLAILSGLMVFAVCNRKANEKQKWLNVRAQSVSYDSI
eukprot:74756_1